ncbi:Hypothetical protein Minf_2372 [Methylacidiphilum infernorum V4]|uniref:Uncharacterized protein n=1 Tax=Methylacidiphilum infernorum (isolate V4) TaxID=481448 RepID=B3E0U9_METI4|nr:Hypothetical protein Minf_2372 [Methylacidiphilum infernorum V4]
MPSLLCSFAPRLSLECLSPSYFLPCVQIEILCFKTRREHPQPKAPQSAAISQWSKPMALYRSLPYSVKGSQQRPFFIILKKIMFVFSLIFNHKNFFISSLFNWF